MVASRVLAARLSASLALGSTCAVGSSLRVSVRLRSTEVDRCAIRIASAAQIIEPITQEVSIRPDDSWQRIDLNVLARKVSAGRDWVELIVETGGTPVQVLGFFLEVVAAPSIPVQQKGELSFSDPTDR